MPRAAPGPPFRIAQVLFDVDGTLVNYGLAMRVAFAAAAARCSEITQRTVTGEDIRVARMEVVRIRAGSGARPQSSAAR